MPVYAILLQGQEGVELLPNYFSTYLTALAEVKIIVTEKFPDWDDRFNADGTENIYALNKIEVGEGHKLRGSRSVDPNLTELYIEPGNHIFIRKLILKPIPIPIIVEELSANAAAGGRNTRRRHRKRNIKNSRKHKY
jgi:hypothetical protein